MALKWVDFLMKLQIRMKLVTFYGPQCTYSITINKYSYMYYKQLNTNYSASHNCAACMIECRRVKKSKKCWLLNLYTEEYTGWVKKVGIMYLGHCVS